MTQACVEQAKSNMMRLVSVKAFHSFNVTYPLQPFALKSEHADFSPLFVHV
jgi:hypothetical protein